MVDFAKLWYQKNLNTASINRARDVISLEGKALPCVVMAVSGSIVTVSFQVDSAPYVLPRITIPKVESNWIRYPTQIGDTGITIPADVYHGIISGLGSGLPDINVQPGNLSALIFVPVSNKGFPPIDPNAAQVQGPNGAIIRTTGGTASSIVLDTSGTTITFGSNTFVINAGGITMTVGGKVVSLTSTGFTIDGILFETHEHTGVAAGAAKSGGPTNP